MTNPQAGPQGLATPQDAAATSGDVAEPSSEPLAQGFRADWLAAQMEGEQRNLAWYLERAQAGDQQAARRAIRWMVDSLTPAAQAQNHGLLDPQLADALHALLAPVAQLGDSTVLRVARQGPSHRPPDVDKQRRVWWACVDMHRRLSAAPELSQLDAAADTLDGDHWCEADSLAKHYRRLLSAVSAFVAETDADESPPAFPP